MVIADVTARLNVEEAVVIEAFLQVVQQVYHQLLLSQDLASTIVQISLCSLVSMLDSCADADTALVSCWHQFPTVSTK